MDPSHHQDHAVTANPALDRRSVEINEKARRAFLGDAAEDR
jgi:hypothetical protein